MRTRSGRSRRRLVRRLASRRGIQQRNLVECIPKRDYALHGSSEMSHDNAIRARLTFDKIAPDGFQRDVGDARLSAPSGWNVKVNEGREVASYFRQGRQLGGWFGFGSHYGVPLAL